MPFTIPNEAGAGFADQAEPEQRDFEILAAGIAYSPSSAGNYGAGPTGVELRPPISSQPGCAVTAQGVPDMTVAVAAGTVRIGGRRVAVAAGNVTITAADATNPRFDLIVVDTAGAKTAIAGTPAANAVFPTITAGRCVLAAVYVPATDTAINTNQITDKRVVIDEPPWENVKWYGATGGDSGNDAPAIQAAHDAAYDVSVPYGRTRTVYFPPGIYRVASTITMNEGVRFEGAGHPTQDSRYGSYLTATTIGMSVITVPNDATLRQGGVELSHLGFATLPAATGVTGVTLYNINRYRIDNCAFLSPGDGEMSTGIFLRLDGTGMDMNWNNITRCEFRKVTVGIDALGLVGLSVQGCHFIPSAAMTTGYKGVLAGANSGASVNNTTAVNLIDCSFTIPSNGIGAHIQGNNCKITSCVFEGVTGSTGNTGVKIEKVAGSPSNAGRRNQITSCSILKCATTAIDVGSLVEDTTIITVDYESNGANLTDAGIRTTYLSSTLGEIGRLSVALDWPQVTAPANPASGFHRFYVDTADGIFKSRTSTGTISIYGARTRALFLDASILRMNAAVGVKLGSPPNAVDGVQFTNASTSGAYCNFIMPVDVITGLVKIRPIWAPGATTGAATVQWQMNIRILSAVDVTAAGTTLAWTGASAARTVNVEVLEPGQDSTGVSPAASDRIRLEVTRLGSDASDTYTGDVNLLGLRIDYQANN